MASFERESWLAEPGRSEGKSHNQHREASPYNKIPKDLRMILSFGSKFNRHMSVIRQYFCFFVFLDLALHFLIYLQYLKHVTDYTLLDLIGCQMKCYNIGTSLVDIPLISLARFIVLESAYGLGRSNSWASAGLSTATTTLFSIIKPSYYQWKNDCQTYWPILMTVLSVTFAWLETFLVQYHMITMENLANHYDKDIKEMSEREVPRIGFFQAMVPITKNLFAIDNSSN